MQVQGTIVAFGTAPLHDAARLDATALSCEIFSADFRQLKQAQAGSLLILLCAEADDPALAAATKAAQILRRRGGGESLLVLPPVPANPGPQAFARLERAARLSEACVVQPVSPATWADAVRCFVEPLAVYGLAGVDPREIHALVRPRAALLHHGVDGIPREARDLLVTCRLRPNASLRDLDDAARAAAERAPDAHLVLAGPEVGEGDGPRLVVASLF